MFKKTATAVAMTALLALQAPVCALATTATMEGMGDAGTVTVSTTYKNTYKLTIPDTIQLNGTTPVTSEVTVSDVFVESGKGVALSMTSANGQDNQGKYSLSTSDGSTVKYSIANKKGTDIVNGSTIVTVTASSISDGFNDATTDLVFSLAGNATSAGTYSDTLTFTASLV